VSRFEDRLWGELVEQHGALLAEPPARVPSAPRRFRRAPVAALALALVIGLVALVIALGRGGGTSAYAVVTNPDGTVTVTINELIGVEPADERLQELGVPVRIPPIEPGCRTSRAELKSARLSPARSREISEPTGGAGHYSLRIDPAAIPAGDTLVVTAHEVRPGVIWLRSLVIEGPAPSCVAPAPHEFPQPSR
jgi:hypothetical protein